MTREELKEHCERQIQQFERVEKIMPVTPNDWKRYEEHKLILELLEQEPKIGYWKTVPYEDTLFCSHCNLRLDDEQTYIPLHYCPNCGYKMESEKEYEQRKIHK